MLSWGGRQLTGKCDSKASSLLGRSTASQFLAQHFKLEPSFLGRAKPPMSLRVNNRLRPRVGRVKGRKA